MERRALILGGARSGKSALAERLGATVAQRNGSKKIYLATARRSWDGVEDPEFAARIAEHQARRGPDWETLEAPETLVEALRSADGRDRLILVDCLTLWLTNVMLSAPEPEAADPSAAVARLLDALRGMEGAVILVSNEVGLGLVPETPLGRRFRDAQGRLNQAVAAEASLVVFTAAGLPLTLKGVLSDWES